MAVAHGRDPRPQARDPLRSRSWRALPLPPLLEGVAENVALHRFRPVPGYGACRFRRACALKRWPSSARAFSLVKTRRPPCACSVCRGSPRRRGRVGRFYADLEGLRLRRYRPGRLVGVAAMTNAGSLAGMWRCISQHVFAIVMARSGRLLSTLRPMAPSIPTREGSRERPWSRGSPEVMGRGEG